jgi:hypothetical protein
VQIDGSDHHWFEERAPACTLLVHVDDATSRLMALHFTTTESTFSYFEATRERSRAICIVYSTQFALEMGVPIFNWDYVVSDGVQRTHFYINCMGRRDPRNLC